MASRALHFTVDFDGMTRQVRDFWAEGSFHRAIEVLVDGCGLPTEIAHDVIRGKRKLAQDPRGKKGIDGYVVSDDWKPNLNRCQYGLYPDPALLPELTRQLYEFKRLYMEIAQFEVRQLLEERKGVFRGDRLLEIDLKLRSFPDEVFSILGEDRPAGYSGAWGIVDWGEDEESEPVHWGTGMPTLDQFVKHELELSKREKPQKDTEFNKPCGWILKNGDFYSCEWHEHDWLAQIVGGISTTQAWKEGWIMVSHPLGKPNQLRVTYGDPEATERQKTTLFLLEQKWGKLEKETGANLFDAGGDES